MFLTQLEAVIDERLQSGEQSSYTATLAESGLRRVAQKVGEEAVEVALAGAAADRAATIEEAADLVYHLLVLLRLNDVSLEDIDAELRSRHGS